MILAVDKQTLGAAIGIIGTGGGGGGGGEITVDTSISHFSTNPVQNKVIAGALDEKQDKLTFDAVPTAGSANPVTSDGIRRAIDDVDSTLNAEMTLSANVYKFNWEQGAIDNEGHEEPRNDRLRSVGYTPTFVSPVFKGATTKNLFTYIRYYDADFVYRASDNDVYGRNSVNIDNSYAYYRLVVLDYTNESWTEPITPDMIDGIYTATYTSDLVKQVKNTINNLVVEYASSKWEIGAIDSSGNKDNSYRVRTADYISCEDYSNIEIDNTGHCYFTYIYYYDANKTYATRDDHLDPADKLRINIEIDKQYAYFRVVVLDFKNSSWEEPIAVEAVSAAYSIFSYHPVIQDMAARIETIEAEFDPDAVSYPEYFKTQLMRVSEDVKRHNELVGKDGVSFIFCTDLHWDKNKKHSPALLNYIVNNTSVNLTLLGGDYISQFQTSKQTAIDTMRDCMAKYKKSTTELYPIFGNHDRNSNGQSTPSSVYMSKGETYSIINAWMSQRAIYSDEYFDFYFDDNKSKTRFICLDTGASRIDSGEDVRYNLIDLTSRTWCNSIISELPKEWHVVIIAHWLFTPAIWNSPLVDGRLNGSYPEDSQSLFEMLDNINADTSKAKIEAIITGHVHCDCDDRTSGGIPIIYTDTDSMDAYGEYTATTGTISEQCFDIVTIDFGAKKIYCDRIGRGESREITY